MHTKTSTLSASPPTSRWSVSEAARRAKATVRPLKRKVEASVQNLTRWLHPPFQREMIRIEHARRPGALESLLAFDEMRTSAWLGLESIGFQLVRSHRPQVVVELGTHMGLSALAMGLALRENGGGKLYAVDTWEGEEHAGRYSESVYETFMKRRKALGLEETVIPLRMLFDDARDQISEPIDLLHIDGLHTWDAVSHDWETFSPKVRPGGIVIFHDVNTIHVDVRRFWEGLKGRFETYTVAHSNGLGILKMPG